MKDRTFLGEKPQFYVQVTPKQRKYLNTIILLTGIETHACRESDRYIMVHIINNPFNYKLRGCSQDPRHWSSPIPYNRQCMHFEDAKELVLSYLLHFRVLVTPKQSQALHLLLYALGQGEYETPPTRSYPSKVIGLFSDGLNKDLTYSDAKTRPMGGISEGAEHWNGKRAMHFQDARDLCTALINAKEALTCDAR